MRYDEFRERVMTVPVVTSAYLKMAVGHGPSLNNQLTRWTRAGKLLPLKRGAYLLNEKDRALNPSRSFIAGQLYPPSYLSLEYALSFYGLIPERVFDLTSITTRKTASFTNQLGAFTYRHLKPGCFSGFHEETDEAGLVYHLADPEKALVDFLYLNQKMFAPDPAGVLTGSLRLQNTNLLSRRKLAGYVKPFASRKLITILQGL